MKNMESKKYPQDKDIKEHKDRFWTTLLQYYKGLVPIESVEQKLRSLMGDATLWIKNNSPPLTPLNLEKIKKEIASLKLSQIKATITRPNNKSFIMYFSSVQDLEKFKIFVDDGIKNTQKKVLEKAITGKEFAEQSLEKATKWNHGVVPKIGIRHTFLHNALNEPGVKVFVEENKNESGGN